MSTESSPPSPGPDALAYLTVGQSLEFRVRGTSKRVVVVQLLSDSSAWGLGYLCRQAGEKRFYFVKLGKIRLEKDRKGNRTKLPTSLQAEKSCREIRESFEREEFYGRSVGQEPRLVKVLDTSSIPVAELELNKELLDREGRSTSELISYLGAIKVPICLQEFAPEPELKAFLDDTPEVSAQWFFAFFHDLTDVIGAIHEKGHVHNDLHWKNVKVSTCADGKPSAKVFDYGLSTGRYENSRNREQHLSHYFASQRYINSTLGDLESVGRLMLATLCRVTDPQVYEDATKSRTYIRGLLSKFGPSWVSSHPMLVDVLSRCLTTRLASKIKSASELKDILDLARVAGASREKATIDQVSRHVKRIQVFLRQSEGLPGDLLRNLLLRNLRRLEEQHQDINQGYFELFGDRGDLLDTLVTLLSGLQPGDTYTTFSDFGVWHPSNYGPKGRFLGLNEQLVRNGVNVHRFFHFSLDERDNPSYIRHASLVLEQHRDLQVRSCLPDSDPFYKPCVIFHPGAFKHHFSTTEWPQRRGAVVTCAEGQARYLIVPVTAYDKAQGLNQIVGHQCYYWSEKKKLSRNQDLIKDRIDSAEATFQEFELRCVTDPNYEMLDLDQAITRLDELLVVAETRFPQKQPNRSGSDLQPVTNRYSGPDYGPPGVF